ADVEIELVSVAGCARSLIAEIRRGHDGEQARLPRTCRHAVAAGRGDGDLRPEIAEPHFGAYLPNSGHPEHTGAVRWGTDRSALIAGGSHDQYAALCKLGRSCSVGGCTAAFASKTKIDDMSGIRIVRHACYGESSGPSHRRDDVRIAAAAFSHDSNRQDPSVPCNTRHADAIVGFGRDHARNARSMPRALADFTF